MSSIKVLGIGSPFGEDQAGWKVVDIINHRFSSSDQIRKHLSIECCDRPGIRLINLMQSFHTVFLIDAVISGNQPGTIHRLINQEIHEVKTISSTHHIGISQALEIGHNLGSLPPKIILYGIEIIKPPFNNTISPAVYSAINETAILLASDVMDELSNINGVMVNELSHRS